LPRNCAVTRKPWAARYLREDAGFGYIRSVIPDGRIRLTLYRPEDARMLRDFNAGIEDCPHCGAYNAGRVSRLRLVRSLPVLGVLRANVAGGRVYVRLRPSRAIGCQHANGDGRGVAVRLMKRIDFSEFTRVQPENNEVARQMNPQREARPQADKEQNPDYHQRKSETRATAPSAVGGLAAERGRHGQGKEQRSIYEFSTENRSGRYRTPSFGKKASMILRSLRPRKRPARHPASR